VLVSAGASRKSLVPFPKQYIEVSEEDMVKAEDS